MKFRFSDRKLELLYEQQVGAPKYPESVLKGLLGAISIIDAADSLNDLRLFKGRHLEKLKTSKEGQYSYRLDKQFRLILRHDQKRDEVILDAIEDYH